MRGNSCRPARRLQPGVAAGSDKGGEGRRDEGIRPARADRETLTAPPFGHGVDKTTKNGSVLVTQAKNENQKNIQKSGKTTFFRWWS